MRSPGKAGRLEWAPEGAGGGAGEDPRGVCVNRVHGSHVNCVFEVCVLYVSSVYKPGM